jgi:hypothetical protein
LATRSEADKFEKAGEDAMLQRQVALRRRHLIEPVAILVTGAWPGAKYEVA